MGISHSSEEDVSNIKNKIHRLPIIYTIKYKCQLKNNKDIKHDNDNIITWKDNLDILSDL